ncbi:hypothetical protein [Photobacterium kishitanii]|nr:hypothetical protein [Photobacterium kishitanii]
MTKYLLIGNLFSNISTVSKEVDLKEALSERFELLDESDKERLLSLRV